MGVDGTTSRSAPRHRRRLVHRRLRHGPTLAEWRSALRRHRETSADNAIVMYGGHRRGRRRSGTRGLGCWPWSAESLCRKPCHLGGAGLRERRLLEDRLAACSKCWVVRHFRSYLRGKNGLVGSPALSASVARGVRTGEGECVVEGEGRSVHRRHGLLSTTSSSRQPAGLAGPPHDLARPPRR